MHKGCTVVDCLCAKPYPLIRHIPNFYQQQVLLGRPSNLALA